MVQRIGVDVDAAPDAGVVGSDRYDPKAWLDALEMSFPKIVRRRLADNACFTVLFTILPLLLNLVRAVRNVKARKYRLEPGNILHLRSLRGKKATRRWPLITGLEVVLGCRSHALALVMLDLDGASSDRFSKSFCDPVLHWIGDLTDTLNLPAVPRSLVVGLF